jgi:hypothetical protein
MDANYGTSPRQGDETQGQPAQPSDPRFQFGAVSEATAAQIQDLLAGKGTVLGSVGIDVDGGGQTDTVSVHHFTTTIYVDGASQVHVVTIDVVTTGPDTVLEILSDVVLPPPV